MKRIINIFSLLLILTVMSGSVSGVYAQDAKAVMGKISVAIKSGSSEQLSTHFNQNVEVTIPGVDQRYAKNQAQFVLKDFFAKHPAQGYTSVHEGNSGTNYYAIGTYKSPKGTFDTHVLLKNVGGKFLINEIRFEAE